MVVLGGGEPGGNGVSAGTDPLGAGAAGFFPQRHPRHCERGSLCRLFCVAGAGLVFEAGVLLVASAPGLCERDSERRPGVGLGRAVGGVDQPVVWDQCPATPGLVPRPQRGLRSPGSKRAPASRAAQGTDGGGTGRRPTAAGTGEDFAQSAAALDGAVCVRGACLLYTSDAADEEDSVDLGGRRIIKK